MASNNRSKFTLNTRISQSIRLKWAIGIGLAASVALAGLIVSLDESRPQDLSAYKTAVVKISPIQKDNPLTKVEAGASKEISKIVRLQSALNYDKSSAATTEKQVISEKLALLKALEDVQLKRKLHADDPAFDHEIWTQKQKTIEEKVVRSTH
ncbi:MAG: hypothetical protein AAFN10_07485 [Bacteroidota bacterium]